MGLFNFPQVDSNVNVIFSVDGDEYAVEQFKIAFHRLRKGYHDSSSTHFAFRLVL